jgi:NAD+ diphosphatase
LAGVVEAIMSGGFSPSRNFCAAPGGPRRVMAFFKDRLVVATRGAAVMIPRPGDLAAAVLKPGTSLRLGTLRGKACEAWGLSQAPNLSDGLELAGLRTLYGRLAEDEFQAAGYAMQLLNWAADHRFCGRCASPMVLEMEDRALSCPDCRYTIYPRISPAVIVAITSGDRLLLARSGRFPGRRMFSVIAGYVEPGETLEDCVRREIREEVGLTVRRIRYFGSQAWPFSGSLMVGFTAEHAAGRIAVDGKEILEADWFAPDRLPEIPGKISIARELIDWFVDNH